MNKNIVIVILAILLISVSMSGCNDNKTNNNSPENDNYPKTDIIMTEWDYDLHWDTIKGDYIIINLIIKNIGPANATGVSVKLVSTNQNNLLECNKSALLPNLPVNEVDDAYFKFDYEEETILLNNKIIIRWKGGSKEYFREIYL